MLWRGVSLRECKWSAGVIRDPGKRHEHSNYKSNTVDFSKQVFIPFIFYGWFVKIKRISVMTKSFDRVIKEFFSKLTSLQLSLLLVFQCVHIYWPLIFYQKNRNFAFTKLNTKIHILFSHQNVVWSLYQGMCVLCLKRAHHAINTQSQKKRCNTIKVVDVCATSCQIRVSFLMCLSHRLSLAPM